MVYCNIIKIMIILGKAYLVECLSDPNPIKKRCVIKQMNLAGMTD